MIQYVQMWHCGETDQYENNFNDSTWYGHVICSGKHLCPLRAVHNNTPDKACDFRQRETQEMRNRRKDVNMHICKIIYLEAFRYVKL